MTAEFVLHFDSVEEFLRLIQLLKKSGFKDISFKPNFPAKKPAKQEKQEWAFGIGNLDGRLDHANIRDYAYEN